MYKWNAEDYEKNSSWQQKLATELIATIDLKGNERILDIGCGDGKVTAEIARNVPNGAVLGIDKSEEMIDYAQSKFPSSNYPNLSFQYGDASQLNFENELDLVVSFSCLHWIIDHIPVLAGIKRSLKPGGRTILQFGGKGNASTLIGIANKAIAQGRWTNYFQDFSLPYGFYGDDEYKEWLNQVGLKPTSVKLIPQTMLQKGKEGLIGWIRTTWLPLTSRIPEELQQEFIEDLANTYVESHPPDSDGFVCVPMTRLKVEATKV